MATRQPSYLALAGAVIALGTAVLYLVLIVGQGERPAVFLPWFLLMALIGALGLFGALMPLGRRRQQLLVLAGAAALVLGLLAIFSVGLLLVVSGLVMLAGAAAPRPAPRE